MLADFRARAALPDEPDCFFFPSARAGADIYAQLAKIFSRSREFEMKAEGVAASDHVDSLPNGLSATESKEYPTTAQQRTKRWVCPEKTPYPSSSSSTSSTISGEIPRTDRTTFASSSHLGASNVFKYNKECSGTQPGLTEVRHPTEEAGSVVCTLSFALSLSLLKVLEVGNPSPEPPRPPSAEDGTKFSPGMEWDVITSGSEILPNVEVGTTPPLGLCVLYVTCLYLFSLFFNL